MEHISNLNPVVPPSYPSSEGKKPSFDKTLNKVKKIFREFKNTIWAFQQESVKFVINVIHIVAKGEIAASVNSFPQTVINGALHVNKTLGALGLTHFVSMLLNFLHIPFEMKEAVDKGKIDDKEGALRSVLDATASAAEVVYDMSLGVAALTAIGLIPFIVAFSMIVVPFAIVILTYVVAKGVFDIVQQGSFLVAAKRVEGKGQRVLERFLTEKLGAIVVDNEVRFNAKKMSILERRSDKKVVELMQSMLKNLNSESADMEKMNESMNHIKKLMWRRIAINSVGLVANTAMLATVIASVIIPGLPAISIPIVGAGKAGLTALRVVADKTLYKWHDIQKPQFSIC